MTDGTNYYRSKAGKAKRDAEYQRKRADRYQRENEKLRELAVMLWTYIQRPVGTDWKLSECIAILDDAFDRMRDLGIEVGK